MSLLGNIPIKWKMLLTNLVISSAVVVVSAAVMLAFQIVNFRGNLQRDASTLATTIASNSTTALILNDLKGASEALNPLKANPAVISAFIVSTNGAVLASFGNSAGTPDLSRFPGLGGSYFVGWHLLHTESLRTEKKLAGTFYMEADYWPTFRELLNFYGRIAGWVMLLSFALALLLSSILGRAITQPLAQLASTASYVGEKQDYSLRAKGENRSDELGLLTKAFNQMLSRIEAQDQALKESQQRYEASITGVNDGIWDWNIKTDETFFSPQWKHMLGYSDKEIKNRFSSWKSLIHPDDTAPTMTVLHDYLALRRETFAAEFRMKHKNGRYHWVLARGAARREMDGKPYRMTGSQTDINDRKKAEVEVLASRWKYEALVNSIDGIVWEWNPRDCTFTFVSQQSQRMLGYPPESWFGNPKFWDEIVHPDDLERVTKSHAEATARREAYSYEYRIIAADKRVVWIRESGVIQVENDEPVAFRGIFIDITGQKQAADKLAQMNEQIAKTQRQAGMAEVATGVLHNVGNVLNSVNVSASLLRDNVRKSQIQNLVKATNMLRDHANDTVAFLTHDSKGQRLPGFLIKLGDHLASEQSAWQQELDGLNKNIEHIKEIVAMQQSYARLTGVTEALIAQEMVEDALRMNEAALGRHGVKLVRDFEDVSPVAVDKHKVLQILVNLIRNAKYAMDDSGKSDKTLTVLIRANAKTSVKIQVCDNGTGIAQENLVRIFQHGFTTKKDGHGFGLHSGANAAKEMGGNLTVHSDGPGTGATFTLELPVAATDFCPVIKNSSPVQIAITREL